jgi:hypothetical protein
MSPPKLAGTSGARRLPNGSSAEALLGAAPAAAALPAAGAVRERGRVAWWQPKGNFSGILCEFCRISMNFCGV